MMFEQIDQAKEAQQGARQESMREPDKVCSLCLPLDWPELCGGMAVAAQSLTVNLQVLVHSLYRGQV